MNQDSSGVGGGSISIGARSPADIAGETPIKPSAQGYVTKRFVEKYSKAMKSGYFNWYNMRKRGRDDPIRIIRATNGSFIEEGHHRFLASRLAEVEIPDDPRVIQYHDLPGEWPIGAQWTDLQWW